MFERDKRMFSLKKTFDFGIPWPDDEELPDRGKVNIIDISDDDDESNIFLQPEVTVLVENDNRSRFQNAFEIIRNAGTGSIEVKSDGSFTINI